MMAVRLNRRTSAYLEKFRSAIISLVLCFSVGHVLADSDDEFRNLVFKEPVTNQALHGHVIKTEQVLNEGSCRVQCYMEPNCVSINVGPLKDGAHQCELNDATDEDQFANALKEKPAHTYLAIEKNPCSSSPCNNSGTCQAGFTSKGFRCVCPAGTFGTACYIAKVACFIVADKLSKLRDFTAEVNWDNTNFKFVKKCAKLAKAKHYKLFALGKDGICLSGPNMKNEYHIGGSSNAKCKHGIGDEDSMFVYSLEPRPNLQPIGCYKDKRNNRSLPVEYANFRGSGSGSGQIDWHRMELTVYKCAQVAYDKGYEYFAVQYYGVCYGGEDAGTTYAKHGKSADCWEFDKQNGFGVGKDYTNFVYRIKQVG